MAILVAGGCGYIGSHVCKMLHQRGFEVVVYDNLSKGYRDFAKWGELVTGDINDKSSIQTAFENYDIEAVMHFCAFIEVGESVVDPQKYYQNNVLGTLALLESMMEHQVDKFIFSSSAAVYGMPNQVPIREDESTIPINPYGLTKLMVEQVLDDYARAYDFNSIRFRYFNAAGCDPDGEVGEAHVPESHLIPLILDAALGKRDNIKIFGTDYETEDGTCIRDYVHVNDLAEAHVKGLERLLARSNDTTEVYNLGSGNGYSVLEMIDVAKRITGKPFTVVETGRRDGDPGILIADSSKARQILSWETQYNLDRIVETAWNWHCRKG